jgi:hypothetical protein
MVPACRLQRRMPQRVAHGHLNRAARRTPPPDTSAAGLHRSANRLQPAMLRHARQGRLSRPASRIPRTGAAGRHRCRHHLPAPPGATGIATTGADNAPLCMLSLGDSVHATGRVVLDNSMPACALRAQQARTAWLVLGRQTAAYASTVLPERTAWPAQGRQAVVCVLRVWRAPTVSRGLARPIVVFALCAVQVGTARALVNIMQARAFCVRLEGIKNSQEAHRVHFVQLEDSILSDSWDKLVQIAVTNACQGDSLRQVLML